MIPKQRATIIIASALVVAVVVALLPLLYHLASGPVDRGRPIAGEVVSVSGNTLVIKDRRGTEFNLQLSSSTKNHLPDGDTPTPGMNIQAFGTPDQTGAFVLSNIRPLKVRGL